MENHEPQMIYAYFTPSELEGLDNGQGGISLDPDTGLREYSAWEEIIKIPQIQELFKTVWSDLQDDGKLTPDLEKVYKAAKKGTPAFREEDAGKEPVIDKVEQLGEGKDKKLAYIPLSLAKFLIDLNDGHYSLNPKDGLLQFGWNPFRSVQRLVQGATNIVSAPARAVFGKNAANEFIRIAGTLGGAYLGGPMGAGLGNAAASWATGKSPGDSIWSGAKNGALAYGLGQGAQALGMGATNGLTAPFQMGAIPQAGSGIGSFFGMGNAAPPAAGAPGSAQAAGAQSGLGGFLGKAGDLLSSPAGIAAAMAGLSFMGSKKHQKEQQKEAHNAREELKNIREDMGFKKELGKTKRKRWIFNHNAQPTQEDRETGRLRGPIMNLVDDDEAPALKTGGRVAAKIKNVGIPLPHKSRFVKGPGNGQDDKIKTTVPADSYIIDASTVSMAGDGSSNSGAKAFQELEQAIKKKFHQKHPTKKLMKLAPKVGIRKPAIPVYLSNEEYEINPSIVTMAGNGSNAEGAKSMKLLVKRMRRLKNRNGNRLPPKAPPLINLLRM